MKSQKQCGLWRSHATRVEVGIEGGIMVQREPRTRSSWRTDGGIDVDDAVSRVLKIESFRGLKKREGIK